MSQFSLTLRRVLTEREITASQLEENSGVDNAKISRILAGQLAIKPHDLISLVRHSGRNDDERAQLLAAYLNDCCVGDPKVTNKITIAVNGKATESELKLPKLPTDLSDALQTILRELPRNRNLQDSIMSLSKFLT